MTIDLEKLARLIKEKLDTDNLTLERASKQSGVSVPTLSRLQRNSRDGQENLVPHVTTLMRISEWLGISLTSLTESEIEATDKDAYLPDIIAAHMRADKNLGPDDAKALNELFKFAYEQALKRGDGSKKNEDGRSDET